MRTARFLIHGPEQPLLPARRLTWPVTAQERAVVRFATLQIFVLIYLQKFALFSPSFPLSVPMLTWFAGLTWMAVSRHLAFSPPRLAAYFIFTCCVLLSQAIAWGSLPSLFELLLLYGGMTLRADIPPASYRQILDRFTLFMIPPACIIITQYVYQKLTGLSNPITMTGLIPESWLTPNFIYEAHYPWNSPFMRPNGFFFLETSFASAFAASAAIIELTYFHRRVRATLMLTATFLSLGATGITMLIVAAPFLLPRSAPRVALRVAAGAVCIVVAIYAAGIPLPLSSRFAEISDQNSSGGERLLLPAMRLQTLATDPSYLVVGDGAGSGDPKKAANSARTPVMNAWPIVKLIQEYGLLTMISFVLLYVTGIAGDFNVPLKAALSVIFLFTGGYLLSPIMVELLLLFCFVLAPPRSNKIRDHGIRARSLPRP
jgi:hypothetical protein